jgi:spermidine synthase
MGILGFASAVIQVTALRETGFVFHGSEMVMGVVLAAWLLLSAIGVMAGARWVGRRGVFLPVGFGLLGVLGPLTLLAVRLLPLATAHVPGQTMGFTVVVAASSVVLLPFCVVAGALFPLGLRAFAGQEVRGYLVEALGFLAGGLALSFVFLPLTSTSTAVLAASAACLGCAAIDLLWDRPLPARAAALLLLLLGAGAAIMAAGPFDRWSRGFRHPGEDVLETVDTPHGTFTVTQARGQVNFYASGSFLWSLGNRARAEEVAHTTLLAHPRPSRLLLVGGGGRGLLPEVLRHPVRAVTCVDLDPVQTRHSLAYLPESDRRARCDPRVSLIFADGRRHVRLSAPGAWDLILADLPDPSTGALNRYYTHEFFAEAKAALAPDGLFVMTLSSSGAYRSRPMQVLAESVIATLLDVFPHIGAVRTDHGGYLFFGGKGALTLSGALLARRYAQRGIEAMYFTPAAIAAQLKRPGPQALIEEVRALGNPEINRDVRPLCYRHHFALWQARTTCPDERARDKGLAGLLALLAAAAAAGLLSSFHRAGVRLRPNGLVLAGSIMAGAATMGFEVSIFLAFQATYGVVWGRIGMLAGVFMLGAVLGAWAGLNRWTERTRRPLGVTLLSLGALLAGAALLMAPVGRLGGLSPLIFYLLSLLLGGGCLGLAFPLAVRSLKGEKAAAVVYTADLAGAALGGFALPAFLLPMLGMAQALGVMAALLAAIGIALGVRNFRMSEG